MGEVYRARDSKLDRDVAIKILPEAFVRDPERITRFEREARLLAALNHPNIAGIYGLDEAVPSTAPGTGRTASTGSSSGSPPQVRGSFSSHALQFIVMELVEGDTLAAKLTASGMGVPTCPLTKRSRSPARSLRRSKRPTKRASFTAI